MKTFRFIGMALLAIVMCVNFASCSSDDDEKDNSSLLIGRWQLVSDREVYEFKANGEFFLYEFDEDGDIGAKGTWEKSGNSLKLKFTIDDDDFKIPYTYNAKIIELTTIRLVFEIGEPKETYTLKRID